MAKHFRVQVHAIFLLVFLVSHASTCEQENYWQMKLPKVPMPQAIKDDLFHSKDDVAEKITKPLASMKPQPFTVGAWKYNADDIAEKITKPLATMKPQPFTVGAWKYNTYDAAEKITKPLASIKPQPFTVGAWKYNADDAAEKITKPLASMKPQPFTVGAWKYNADDAVTKPLASMKPQPFTVGAWKYNAYDAAEKITKPLASMKPQPFTVGAWKYNANDAIEKITKPLASMKPQPFTVGAWKYNADDAVKKITKPLASMKPQPFTVGAWKYNAYDDAEKITKPLASMKLQPFTVGAWKYNANDVAENAESHDHPQHLILNNENSKYAQKDDDEDLSYGSVFFVEKSLRLGMKLKHDFQKTPKAPFLPKNIAKTMPFSEDKFTEILNLFSLKSESPEATGIQGTLDACLHRPKVKKENRTCAQSMEDVVDFVIGELGTNDVELRMMKRDIKVVNGIQDYVITKVNKLDVPGNTAVACHRMNYPYVVYYCHHQKDIGHYDVTLVSPTTGTPIQTTAVCHYDTYAWQPDVPALRYLGIKPGDAPVCHFSAVNDMFWALNPNTKFLKMV